MDFTRLVVSEIEQLLGLDRRIVGVRLIGRRSHQDALTGVRFCEGLVRALNGESIVFEGSGTLCHASDAALGFAKPKYADIQPRISTVTHQAIIAPLADWPFKGNPKTAIMVCNPSQAMHIANAVESTMAHIDGEIAVCGLVAYTTSTEKPSLSLLCNSCRLYAGILKNELAVSFPCSELDQIRDSLGKMEAVVSYDIGSLSLTPSSKLVYKILTERGRSTQQNLRDSSGLSERAIRGALSQLKRRCIISERQDFSDMRKRLYELSKR